MELSSPPPVAHVVQQRAGRNMSSAIEALASQASEMEKNYLDSDSDGDSVGAFEKSFVRVVSGALKKGDNVSLVGFGSFSISKRAALSKKVN